MPVFEKTVHSWTEDSLRIFETPSLTTKASFLYIQEIGLFQTFHPYYTQRKDLSSYLIILTTGGQGVLEYRDRTYALKPGDLFLIDCKDLHTYYTPKGKTWNFHWVHFHGLNAPGYYAYYKDRISPVIAVKNTKDFAGKLQRMIDLTVHKPRLYALIVANILSDMLTELILWSNGSTRDIDAPPYIDDMLKDMNKNFQKPLQLNHYGEQLGISPYYLSRMFKRYTGTTFQEYLIKNRLSEAKNMLRYTEKSIGSIAQAVGIDNPSHFINLFKAREGTTPHQYRIQWRK